MKSTKRPQSTLCSKKNPLNLTSEHQQIKSIKFKFVEYEVFNVMASGEISKEKTENF